MTMRKTFEVIAQLAQRGVIKDYAIAGAVAALNYIEPMLTEDIDVLVSIGDFEQRASGLVLLTPIETALAAAGYRERTEVGIRIEDWPVQFLPVASELDEAALREACEVEIDGSPPLKVRMLSAEHVVAKAITLGRSKDFARVDAFLAQDAVDLDELKRLLARFNLMPAWSEYCLRTGRKNPFVVGSGE
jgi:hypothetical protein